MLMTISESGQCISSVYSTTVSPSVSWLMLCCEALLTFFLTKTDIEKTGPFTTRQHTCLLHNALLSGSWRQLMKDDVHDVSCMKPDV